jgi:hypothetical protein
MSDRCEAADSAAPYINDSDDGGAARYRSDAKAFADGVLLRPKRFGPYFRSHRLLGAPTCRPTSGLDRED